MEKKNWVPIVRWVARIWSLGPILFGLAEVLFPGHGVQEGASVHWTEWMGLGILGISIIGLAIAWRWERFGGWLSAASLAVFLIVFLVIVERSFPIFFIFLLAIGVPATLFLVVSYKD